MELGEGTADLHLHTPASDGTDDVDLRVEQAIERDLTAIAVTDHDVINDWCSARTVTERGIEVITGVEIRADIFDTKIELLGYYVDPEEEDLKDALSAARQFRTDRNREMVRRLSDATNLDLSYESLNATVDGTLGRPHLAEKLVDAGMVDSIGGAFDEYLGSDGDAYVPMERLPFETVIEAINAACGAASLAHPGRIRSDRVPEMVSRLVEAGLDGIEVWYPYDEFGPEAYAEIGLSEALELAETHGLIPTGGSDCHGGDSDKFRIGEVRSPSSTVEALRETADGRGEAKSSNQVT